MKKHLVAFLSMIGLAGSAAPSPAQVLKGAGPADQKLKSKTESQIKQGKQIAEKNATNAQIQDKREDKWAKADAENKAAKNETWVKGNKTAAEIKANKNQSKLKLQQETLRNQNTAADQKNALTKAGLTKGALTKAKGAEQK